MKSLTLVARVYNIVRALTNYGNWIPNAKSKRRHNFQAVRVIDQIEHGIINMAHMVLIITVPWRRIDTTKAVFLSIQIRLEIYYDIIPWFKLFCIYLKFLTKCRLMLWCFSKWLLIYRYENQNMKLKWNYFLVYIGKEGKISTFRNWNIFESTDYITWLFSDNISDKSTNSNMYSPLQQLRPVWNLIRNIILNLSKSFMCFIFFC